MTFGSLGNITPLLIAVAAKPWLSAQLSRAAQVCWANFGPFSGWSGSLAPNSLPTEPPMNAHGPFACFSGCSPVGFTPFFQTS